MAANADVRGSFASPRTDLEQNTLGTFEVLESNARGRRQAHHLRLVCRRAWRTRHLPNARELPDPGADVAVRRIEDGVRRVWSPRTAKDTVSRATASASCRCSARGIRTATSSTSSSSCSPIRTRLQILGDGSQRKSYLHVEDCVRALMHICDDVRPAAAIAQTLRGLSPRRAGVLPRA